MSKLDELRNKTDDAYTHLCDLRDARREWVREQTRIIEAAAAERFDGDIKIAHEAHAVVQAAFDVELHAARSRDTGWLPVGTKVQREMPTHSWGRTKKTVYGLVEVWGPASLYANNVKYRPEAGTLVVRLLRADGTPSRQYERLTTDFGGGYIHIHWKESK